MLTTKRLVLISLFIAQAAALSIVERFISIPVAIPGIKLGLANVITLLAILMLGWKDALLIVILRCSLAAMVGGNPIGFLFSICGGLLSTVVMAVLWQKFGKHVSIINISLLGAVAHNTGQLFVAALIIQDFRVYVYLPVLLVSALVTGYIVGVVTLRCHQQVGTVLACPSPQKHSHENHTKTFSPSSNASPTGTNDRDL